jgi:transposase
MSVRPTLFRNDGTPVGIQSVSERARVAYRMQVEGATCTEIAELYGVSVSTVKSWLAQVRAAKMDERAIAMLRGHR